MLNQETAKKAMAVGVERKIGRRDIPMEKRPVIEPVTVQNILAQPTFGYVLEAAKPKAQRGTVIENGIRATMEDLMNNPSKYEGRAFRSVNAGTVVQVDGWGPTIAPRGEFIIEGIRQSTYAKGMVDVDGKYLAGANKAYLPMIAKVVEVEEVAFDPEELARAEAAAVLQEANDYDYIGADPEVFAVDAEGNLVPAFEFLRGANEVDKREADNEQDEDDRMESGEPFWDGYQAEFNTTPDTCLAYHTDSVRSGLLATLTALRKKHPKGKLSVKTTFDIPPDRLLSDDPQYVNFGCTPSKSVYGEKFPDVDPASIPFRSAGGHLHFSMLNKKAAKDAVKELDRVLGVICVSLFQYYDDPRRRILYGRAGEYRLPKYGIEYRTLSNAWMIHPATAHFVYEIGRRNMGMAQKTGPWGVWKTDEDEVRKCINECDVALAHKILTENMEPLKLLLQSLPTQYAKGTTGYVDRWVKVIFDGIHTVLSNPDEYSNKWVLNEDAWKTGTYWAGHSEGQCGNFTKTMQYMLDNDAGLID